MLKTRNILRTVFFMPNLIGGLLLGFVWQFIFVKGFASIGQITGISLFELPWLGDAKTAILGHRDCKCMARSRLYHAYLHSSTSKRTARAD